MAIRSTDTVKSESPSTDPTEAEIECVDEPAVADSGDSTDDDANGTAADQAVDKRQSSPEPTPRRLSVSFQARSLVYAVLIAMLVSASAAFAWLYMDARHELDTQVRGSHDNAHAEQVSLDYAVNAATMNFKDLNGWKTKLVAGTSPELNEKLTKAAESMEQILVPLQWTSTAQPLIAKVHSDVGGVYVVDCFVSVQTKTVQAPDALQSTATYSLTLDSNKNWQITDVGGIGSVVGQK